MIEQHLMLATRQTSNRGKGEGDEDTFLTTTGFPCPSRNPQADQTIFFSFHRRTNRKSGLPEASWGGESKPGLGLRPFVCYVIGVYALRFAKAWCFKRYSSTNTLCVWLKLKRIKGTRTTLLPSLKGPLLSLCCSISMDWDLNKLAKGLMGRSQGFFRESSPRQFLEASNPWMPLAHWERAHKRDQALKVK